MAFNELFNISATHKQWFLKADSTTIREATAFNELFSITATYKQWLLKDELTTTRHFYRYFLLL